MWLTNQDKITSEIKASILVLQHHSVDQQKQYDKNSNYQKSLFGYEFHQTSLKQLLWQLKIQQKNHCLTT